MKRKRDDPSKSNSNSIKLEEGEPPKKKRKITKEDVDALVDKLSKKPLHSDVPISPNIQYTVQELNQKFDKIKEINIYQVLKRVGFELNENLHFSLTTEGTDVEKHFLLPKTEKTRKWLDEMSKDWNKQLQIKNLIHMYGEDDPVKQEYTVLEIFKSMATAQKYHLHGVPKIYHKPLNGRTISMMLLENSIRKGEGKPIKYQFFMRNGNYDQDDFSNEMHGPYGTWGIREFNQ